MFRCFYELEELKSEQEMIGKSAMKEDKESKEKSAMHDLKENKPQEEKWKSQSPRWVSRKKISLS
jgi:hypothetical protein